MYTVFQVFIISKRMFSSKQRLFVLKAVLARDIRSSARLRYFTGATDCNFTARLDKAGTVNLAKKRYSKRIVYAYTHKSSYMYRVHPEFIARGLIVKLLLNQKHSFRSSRLPKRNRIITSTSTSFLPGALNKAVTTTEFNLKMHPTCIGRKLMRF